MKILQISKYYYPFIGGTELVSSELAHVFNDLSIQQKVICFNENSEAGGYSTKRHESVVEEINGVEVIRCSCLCKLASQSISLSYIFKLKKVMKEFKPDLVIFHYPNPFVAHLLLKYRKHPYKLWTFWHLDITKQKYLKKLFHHQNLSLIQRSDRIIGTSPISLEESAYSSFFTTKKTLLPLCVKEDNLILSIDDYQKVEELKKKYQGYKIGFFIGRHVEYKGIELLIRASLELKNEKIKFLIAGSGELTDYLKELAKENENVIFLGKISDQERNIYYELCDFFCFPSITRNEAFGLALAEAMYFNKPALTYTIKGSGVNYVSLNNVTGLEVENSNIHKYAEAIKKICSDDELREKLGNNAKERVLKNFSYESFKNRIIELLKEDKR